jgi:hypothetical protein
VSQPSATYYAILLERAEHWDAEVRAALAGGRDIPEPLSFLSVYVEKVTRHAYRVTDDDVQALLAAGASQDHIFEATLAVAHGARPA